MANLFVVSGELKQIKIHEPKQEGKNASAVILVQYGKKRQRTGGAVEFANAVLIRIPPFKFPAVRDKLEVGRKVEVTGHLQGIVKPILNESFVTVELVADRVVLESDNEDDDTEE